MRYGATDSSKQAQAVNKAIQKSPVKQTEIKQLLALAKPERWKLTGMFVFIHWLIIVIEVFLNSCTGPNEYKFVTTLVYLDSNLQPYICIFNFQ